MEEEKEIVIPYIVHESGLVRMERSNHRLWILCIILIIALIASNFCWILYESQFEYYEETITQEVTQDSSIGGINKFVGGDYFGEADN